jgi:hypothetical protein
MEVPMSTIFQRDCLSCAIFRNPCVLYGPLPLVPALLSAANYVCDLPEQEAIAMPAQSKKILIVDSDESVLIALERILEEQGFETTTAWEVNEAIKLMDANKFDILLVEAAAPRPIVDALRGDAFGGAASFLGGIPAAPRRARCGMQVERQGGIGGSQEVHGRSSRRSVRKKLSVVSSEL